jgi:hypothetical protein
LGDDIDLDAWAEGEGGEAEGGGACRRLRRDVAEQAGGAVGDEVLVGEVRVAVDVVDVRAGV